MGRFFILTAAVVAAIAAPAQARVVTTVEEWVEVEDEAPAATTAERFVSGAPLKQVSGIATYGPFRVTDDSHAALVGITDSRSPAEFAAMLRDYPQLATIDMVECPGTFDDIANLELGRMIRSAGLETHVPRGGSVRSGAVELFIAGAQRRIEDGARFAVHAWEDDTGHQAGDYALTAPENAKYLDFYRDMGMSADEAKAFYAMTNSVPFESARWLNSQQMRGWVPTAEHQAVVPAVQAAPQVAFLALDLDFGNPVN